MYILRWLWEGFGYDVSPSVVYWTLRLLMLTLSVVMEDWAIHELVASPRARRVAVLLVASSYVTWTFQTHTFSNSIETLLVLWSLVLIQRIVEDKVPASALELPSNPTRPLQLTGRAETYQPSRLVYSRLYGYRGSLQSYYIPSLPPAACLQPPAALSAQASAPCRSSTTRLG